MTSVAEAKDLTGTSDAAWDSLTVSIGGVPTLRVLGSIPAIAIVASIRAARVASPTAADPTASRDLTILEATQLGLMWRVARSLWAFQTSTPIIPSGLRARGQGALDPTETNAHGRAMSCNTRQCFSTIYT